MSTKKRKRTDVAESTQRKRAKRGAASTEQTTKYLSVEGLDKYVHEAKRVLITSPDQKLCFVDIGCGDGRLLKRVVKFHDMTAIGIDIKEEYANNNESKSYEIIHGDATDDKFSYLFKKGNIILINNMLFQSTTNAKLAKMISAHCGHNTLVITTADITTYWTSNRSKHHAWRCVYKEISEGDADYSPCSWGNKLTIYFYRQARFRDRLSQKLEKRNFSADTLKKYLDIAQNLELAYENGQPVHTIKEMQRLFSARQDVLREILAEFHKQFNIVKKTTRNRST